MSGQLRVSAGQHSDRGRKPLNQDFYGMVVPEKPVLNAKGIALALADGISTSRVAQVASECAVKSFLDDYYCTSESWTVKTSAQRVIRATNSWLHAQTRRSHAADDRDRGYVCTLDAMVLHSATAHIFHIGDGRVYRLAGATLEQLTDDHRLIVSPEQSYLGRALGAATEVEIDYRTQPIAPGDVFVLATDGVHAFVDPGFVAKTVGAMAHDLEAAARCVVEKALENGSPDNLTVQIVRVDEVPDGHAHEAIGIASDLPLPPLLEPRMVFDGYRIERRLHASSRSHVYLATDLATGGLVALKIPSIELREDAAHLRRFMMEEWVARRLDSPNVLKASPPTRGRNFLYVATEYVEGQTLAQWMVDHPGPDLESVRAIVEQLARGLRAFHRKEMLHQDLRPENILIDRTGTVKIIDFGAVRVAGIAEGAPLREQHQILGTMQYTAPEYFLGETGTTRSDLFSLGTIAYQMWTGRLPYGAEVARTRRRAEQRRLVYRTALDDTRDLPSWVDGALARAVSVDPAKRYATLSEFVYDLRHPNDDFRNGSRALLQRNPLLVWKVTSLLLAIAVVLLSYRLSGR